MKNWAEYFRNRFDQFTNHPLKVAGKTVGGYEVNIDQLDRIIDNIVSQLGLDAKDILLDLGCGSGVIANELSPRVGKIYAVDFVEEFKYYFLSADGEKLKNIVFLVDDLASPNVKSYSRANSLICYEVFQYLNGQQIGHLFKELFLETRVKKGFIGGVPDATKSKNFLGENVQDYSQVFFEPRIGFWHKPDTIRSILEDSGWNVRIMSQPVGLYTEQYRFDIVVDR